MIPTADQILKDPAASDWLKNALKTALNRDCNDALNDAETLAVILWQRFAQVTGAKVPNDAYRALGLAVKATRD